MPENRRVGEVREGHLKIFEIISTQSGVLGMNHTLSTLFDLYGLFGRRGGGVVLTNG